jgi:hypothetical protein
MSYAYTPSSEDQNVTYNTTIFDSPFLRTIHEWVNCQIAFSRNEIFSHCNFYINKEYLYKNNCFAPGHSPGKNGRLCCDRKRVEYPLWSNDVAIDHEPSLANRFNSMADYVTMHELQAIYNDRFPDNSGLRLICRFCNSSKGSGGEFYDPTHATAAYVHRFLERNNINNNAITAALRKYAVGENFPVQREELLVTLFHELIEIGRFFK